MFAHLLPCRGACARLAWPGPTLAHTCKCCARRRRAFEQERAIPCPVAMSSAPRVPEPIGRSSTGSPMAGGAADDESASASVDPLDELLANYNFIFQPEMRLKFKQQLPHCSLGLSLVKPWATGPRMHFTLKPTSEGWLERSFQKLLLVPQRSQAAIYSRKLSWNWLRLQFVVGYNWERKKPTLDYRVTTKWGDGPRLKRKERFAVGNHMLTRCKWNLDYYLPDMEGHLGSDNNGMEPVDVDWGRLEFEIAQLDAVVYSPLRLGGNSMYETKSSGLGGPEGAGRHDQGPKGSSDQSRAKAQQGQRQGPQVLVDQGRGNAQGQRQGQGQGLGQDQGQAQGRGQGQGHAQAGGKALAPAAAANAAWAWLQQVLSARAGGGAGGSTARAT